MNPKIGRTVTGGVERLVVMAARLYHVHGLRQREIADRLGLSQARVSRMLKQAQERDIVRTVIAVPDGLHPELEAALEAQFGLQEVHVVDVRREEDVASTLGRAAASYLAEAGFAADVVGFTSWSATLQVMARASVPDARPGARYVVEMLGDLGSPQRQHEAARSTQAMARALGAEAVFLRTPGVAANPEARLSAVSNPHVRRALDLMDRIDIAFVGVGPADVHSGLEAGEPYFTADQLSAARAAGAVGQLNQRFVDSDGRPIRSDLDGLVVGVTLEQLERAGRRIVVAGGLSKRTAVRAALTGRWVDVLITDLDTARALRGAGRATETQGIDSSDRTGPLSRNTKRG